MRKSDGKMPTKKISFAVGDGTVSGTVFTPENATGKCPAVLFIHGWSSNESGYAKRAEPLVKLGYVCLTFDLLGHGNSTGNLETVTLNENISATVAAYDFLASQENVDKDKISVVGTSYGGYLASVLASKRKIGSIVLRVPAIYTDDYSSKAKDSMQSMRLAKEGEGPRNNIALNSISAFRNRILLITAEHDQVIPHRIIELIIKTAKPESLKHVVIKGADHQFSNPEWQEEFIALLIEWFGTRR